jgi:hypothetical protein
MVNTFTVAGINQELHCDNACRKLVEQSFAAKDLTLLPHGPLREVFERQATEESGVAQGTTPHNTTQDAEEKLI